jgi:hypothetical protein
MHKAIDWDPVHPGAIPRTTVCDKDKIPLRQQSTLDGCHLLIIGYTHLILWCATNRYLALKHELQWWNVTATNWMKV